MKNDIGKSPERRLSARSMELSKYGGNKFEENQLEVNQAHVILGQKLHSIATVEANIQQLKQQIEFFSSNNNNITSNNPNTTQSLDFNHNKANNSPNRGRYNSKYGSPVPFLGEVPPTNSVYLGEFRRYLEDEDGDGNINNTRTPASFAASPIQNMTADRGINTSASPYRTGTVTVADNMNGSSGGTYTPVASDIATKQITQLTGKIHYVNSIIYIS